MIYPKTKIYKGKQIKRKKDTPTKTKTQQYRLLTLSF